MTLTAKRATSLKVKAIQKIIRTLPKGKTPEAKYALKDLKKQLANYARYEGDPEKEPARAHLAKSILTGIEKRKAKL